MKDTVFFISQRERDGKNVVFDILINAALLKHGFSLMDVAKERQLYYTEELCAEKYVKHVEKVYYKGHHVFSICSELRTTDEGMDCEYKVVTTIEDGPYYHNNKKQQKETEKQKNAKNRKKNGRWNLIDSNRMSWSD